MSVHASPEPSKHGASADSKAMPPCPHCGHTGTLAPISEDTMIDHNTFVSIRRCLNEACNSLVFYYRGGNGNVEILPYRRIDGRKTDGPPGVHNAIEEATICLSHGCYIAAAIMVRRALAELCASVDIVDGELADRLDALGTLIVVPPALLSGLRDLRMLGSAAASSESEVYSTVSRKEVEIGIDCAEAIFKDLNKYGALVDRLKALSDQSKKAPQ